MKKIECKNCRRRYECEKIAEKGSFRFWGCLQRVLSNNFRPKWVVTNLIEEAKLFLPEYEFLWSGGLCICYAPYGDYVWHFAVRMKQEQLWKYREFQEGYKFGLNAKEPYRDANPYNEFSRSSSWDCGYILGLWKIEDGM